MAAFAAAIAIASAVAGTLKAVSDGRNQEAQFQAQARAQDFNAAMLRQRAETTDQVFNQREEQQLRTNRLDAGKRAAAIGESGAGYGGSNADVDRQSGVMAELDALNIRYEGQMQSSGYLAQAEQESYGAEVNRSSANRSRRSIWLNSAGAILSAAGGYAMGSGGGR